MKRLKKAVKPGELDYVKVEINPADAENMIQLTELDAAMVTGKGQCPKCGYAPLQHQEGFTYCQNCGSAYKPFDDEIYEVI